MLITQRGSGIWSYTLRSAGAILLVSVPATIITSLCRGEARGMMPRRSRSYRGMYAWIISTAQHARPKVIGHRLPVRAQFTTLSRLATRKPLSAISPVMPLITASCSGPGGKWFLFQAIVVSLIGSLPLQRAFAPLVDEADRQHAEKADHRPEAKRADSLQGDRPGKQEGDLEVEDDEEDGDQVVAHIEAAAGIVERLEAAFVSGQLLGVRLLVAG